MTSVVVFRAVFLYCFCATFVHGALRSCITWPNYVTPNDTLPCTCWFQKVFTSTASLQWKTAEGVTVAQGSRGKTSLALPLKNLSRSDGGKPLTCFLVSKGSSTRVSQGSYTPYFAYGPDNITITSTKTYIPEDGSNMTLTCSAKVNPKPLFQWEGHPPEAVILPGCGCGNGTFSETLTFDPRGFKDGDVIRCHVTNSVARWPRIVSGQFTLRYGPSEPQTVSIQQHLAVVLALAAMLMTSLILLFVQWRKNRNHVCERNCEPAVGRWRVARRRGRREEDGERDPLLRSGASRQSQSSTDDDFLLVVNASIQSRDDRE